MPIKVIYKVIKNKQIARDVYFMRLAGDTSCFTAPGQFINILLDGLYLRRPISVCDWRNDSLDIIYKVVGVGTKKMAKMVYGTQLDVLSGLGNGFDVNISKTEKVVVVGGGVGVPPLYNLCKQLSARGVRPFVVLGFRSAADIFYKAEFHSIGCNVQVSTEDGSNGIKGYVTDILRPVPFSYYFTCGPSPMLKAMHAMGEEKHAQGQLSFEEKMGCGFGACMGCSCETLVGPKRVCIEGPIFNSREVNFK